MKREIERIFGLDEYDVKTIAEATHNSAFLEEYRLRNCERRYWDLCELDKVHAEMAKEPCECWACERYGLGAYWDFCCHPDGYYPEHYLNDGRCHCWVCYMTRREQAA